jgi:hypothetical protein
MKTTHGLIIFDYNGPDPSLPNIHAWGFMQTEDIDYGLDHCDHVIKGYEVAQGVAEHHWRHLLTFRVYNSPRGPINIAEQHVFAYAPEALIHNLFKWGTDLAKFDPTLPRRAP